MDYLRINFFKGYGLLVVLFLLLILGGCSLSRKLSAADILRQTQLDFEGVALDSVAIYPNLFPESKGLLPNPEVISFVKNLTQGVIEKEIGRGYLTIALSANNGHKDTLWLKNLKAVVQLDTLTSLPVDLRDSMFLAPGENRILVQTIMPIDNAILHLMEVDTLHFVGRLDVALKEDGDVVPLEFSMDRFVTEEEKQNLKNQATNYIVDSVVSRWLSQFKKK